MQGINTEMGFPPHKKKILSSVLQNKSTAPNGIRENLLDTFGATRVETQTSYQEYEKLKLWALSHTFAPALL